MNKKSLIVVILLLISSATPAIADTSFKYMAFLKGQCESATINQEDFTKICDGAMVTNTLYVNGRTSFGFSSEKAVSFSGSKESNDKEGNYILEVDTITTVMGGKAQPQKATGTCKSKSDFETKATIICDATSNNNHYYIRYAKDAGGQMMYGVGYEPFDLKKNVEYSISLFDIIYSAKGIDGVINHLKGCYPKALKSKWLPAVMSCVSIDNAGYFLDSLVSKVQKSPRRDHFIDTVFNERVDDNLMAFGVDEQKRKVILGVIKKQSITTLQSLIKSKSGR